MTDKIVDKAIGKFVAIVLLDKIAKDVIYLKPSELELIKELIGFDINFQKEWAKDDPDFALPLLKEDTNLLKKLKGLE